MPVTPRLSYTKAAMKVFCAVFFLLQTAFAQTLGQAGAQRVLLIGAAADADEFGEPNRLLEPAYASTLGTQYTMLEPENAMKWNPIQPTQTTYNFEPGDMLTAFAAVTVRFFARKSLVPWPTPRRSTRR